MAWLWSSASGAQFLGYACVFIAAVASIGAAYFTNKASDMVQDELKVRAAQFESEAEQARVDLQRLRERVQWREITPDQYRRLVKSFGEFLKQYAMNVVIYRYEDSETANYTATLRAAIIEAGYNKPNGPSVRIGGPIEGLPARTGIVIADEPTKEARALHAALEDGAVESELAKLNKMGPDRYVGTGELMVEIWRKPAP